MNNSKSIFTSKTFWFNTATLAVTCAGILPPKYGAPIAMVGNVFLRAITDQAVHVFTPEDTHSHDLL